MNEMQHIEKQVGEIDDKVTSILTLLKGHEYDESSKGMIGVQNDHEKRLKALEAIVVKAKWVLIGMAIPASWGAIDIIQKIFLK